ncbi:MAG: anaerobic carbon-monoxide dehydrogenase catalytic subunit [bacterium]
MSSDCSDCMVCSVTQQLIECGKAANIRTAFDRRADQKGCPFGDEGLCCRFCNMGTCRLSLKKPDVVGVCGATGSTIAARHFARMVAAGSSAHSDHGREVAKVFIKAARGEIPGYEIKDVIKLYALAEVYGVETNGKGKNQIAEEVGKKALEEFGRQEGEIVMARRAPETRQAIWRDQKIYPRGVDIEVVELMHRTTTGTDQDYRSIINASMRTSLADGWGGSMVATELQDIMFATPRPVRSSSNLCVLKDDEVNVIVHGHEPLLSEMIVLASRNKELLEYAKSKGAKGINVAGICCTANEVLIRHGIPLLGSFTQQELAIITGAVEVMVVDVQCIMQSLPDIASCFHTEIVTTSRKARIPGAQHIEFDEEKPLETAEKIVRRAIDNFPKRGKTVQIPSKPVELIAGFSHEYVNYMQGGRFRSSYRPLNDNIINGRIHGVAGVVGCDTPSLGNEHIQIDLVKELIANNVLVLMTGCAAHILAREGLMLPEAAREHAGAGLAEVCEAIGIPPVLHVGSCVDNSRILIAATHMVHEGGLGTDISDLPAAGACPDWMHEKAIAIGMYFVASGVYTVFSPRLPVSGSPELSDYLYNELETVVKGKWAVKKTAGETAAAIIDHISKKREALGIHKEKERVLYDMEMRRKLEI